MLKTIGFWIFASVMFIALPPVGIILIILWGATRSGRRYKAAKERLEKGKKRTHAWTTQDRGFEILTKAAGIDHAPTDEEIVREYETEIADRINTEREWVTDRVKELGYKDDMDKVKIYNRYTSLYNKTISEGKFLSLTKEQALAYLEEAKSSKDGFFAIFREHDDWLKEQEHKA